MRLAKRLAFLHLDNFFGVTRGEQPLSRGSSASKSLVVFWFSFDIKREQSALMKERSGPRGAQSHLTERKNLPHAAGAPARSASHLTERKNLPRAAGEPARSASHLTERIKPAPRHRRAPQPGNKKDFCISSCRSLFVYPRIASPLEFVTVSSCPVRLVTRAI